jgi:hypothetical protein
MLKELVAGDSLSFYTTVPTFPPADGWVLNYRLVPQSAALGVIELAAVDAGDGQYRAYASATSTESWQPGAYSWTSWVEQEISGQVERYTLENGQITILPNPRTVAAGYDNRTEWRKALDDAKAALRAWTPTRRRYKIGEREMEFNTSADVIKHITFLEAQVLKEDIAAGRATAPARRIYTRM